MAYQETVTEALRRTRAKLLLIEEFATRGDFEGLTGDPNDTNSSNEGFTQILGDVNHELFEIEKRLDQDGTDKGAAPAGTGQESEKPEDEQDIERVPAKTWNEITGNLFTIEATARVLYGSIERFESGSMKHAKEAVRFLVDLHSMFKPFVSLTEKTAKLTDI